jgi:hypothetical protein
MVQNVAILLEEDDESLAVVCFRLPRKLLCGFLSGSGAQIKAACEDYFIRPVCLVSTCFFLRLDSFTGLQVSLG